MNTSSREVTFVTIGQAPRHDLAAAIVDRLPSDVVVRHRGVLDGLSTDEVSRRYGARADDEMLVTKMSDGSVVTLGASGVSRGLQDVVDRAEADGAGTIVILCTGEFPGLHTRGSWVVEPDAVVTSTAASLLSDRCVGLLIPMPDQIGPAAAKWHALRQPRFGVASPYGEDSALIAAARTLIDEGAQALVLDCMGYAPRHRSALRDAGIGVPVLVSGGVVGAALGAAL